MTIRILTRSAAMLLVLGMALVTGVTASAQTV